MSKPPSPSNIGSVYYWFGILTVLAAATNGILEVSKKSGEEWGISLLMDVIARNAGDPLPSMAGKFSPSRVGLARSLTINTRSLPTTPL